MNVDYIEIGNRVKKFRLERGYTQEKASEMAGLTPTHFSHVETGNTKVSLPTLLKIASALGITLDDLVLPDAVHVKHVSMKELDSILEDCSDAEAKALVMIMEASKKAIRKIK